MLCKVITYTDVRYTIICDREQQKCLKTYLIYVSNNQQFFSSADEIQCAIGDRFSRTRHAHKFYANRTTHFKSCRDRIQNYLYNRT